MDVHHRRIIILCALATMFALVGGLVAAILIGGLVHGTLSALISEDSSNAVAAIIALACVLATGGVWGYALARIMQSRATRRMTIVGALGYGPPLIAVGIALAMLEVEIIERVALPSVPAHLIYTVLFVPATFVVASVGALAISIATEKSGRVRLVFGAGLAAAIAFLVVNVTMDWFGWRVGALLAEQRATMLVVTFIASAAASLAGGAMIGDWARRK
jgi:hypothetical protein